MNANKLTTDQEALVTQWLDGALPPGSVTDAALAQLMADCPELDLPQQASHWSAVSAALRQELPRDLEPPSPDFFTSQIMQEIAPPALTVRPAAASGGFSLLRLLRSAWAAPLAATAALLLVGVFLKTRASRLEMASGPYSPDPSVKATLAFNEEANATVLDLDNLNLADATEIHPFSVASSEAPPDSLWEAQSFYAARSPGQAVFTLGMDRRARPVILASH